MNSLADLIPAGIGVLYIALCAFVLSLFVRLVHAVEKIAQKMPSATPSDSAEAGHLEQIAGRLEAGLRASAGDSL